MATAIQRRRGNTSQHASFTGLAGEITIDTDKNTVVVHDGVTAGGYPLAKASEVAALGGADITAVIAGTGLTGGSTSGNATISLAASGVTAGTYGNALTVPQLTVDTYGRLTGVTNTAITPALSTITGFASGIAEFLAAGNASTFASAVVGTSGSGNIVLATSPVLVTPNLGTPSALVLTNATNLKIEGIAPANILTSAEVFSDTDNMLMTAAAIDDRILSYGYTTNVGDITGVTAGAGLSGGGASGDVTLSLSSSAAGSGLTHANGVLAVGAGTGITVNNDDVALSASGVTAGTYGSAGSVGQVVVDTYGRVTSASNVSISITASQVSDFNTGIDTRVSGGLGLTYTSGVLAVGAGTGITVNANDVALSASGVTAGTYGSATAAGQVVVDTYGRVTSASNVTVTPAVGSITGLGTGVATFLATPSSANLISAITDETGSGALVFGTSPTFTTNINTPAIVKTGTDGTGDIGQSNNKFATVYATTFSGVSTTAKYADLAERYEADDILEPGTVVCFGGTKEITACDHPNDHAVAGVISTDPAYMMNSEAGTDATHPYVALTGRVPVKVTGEVNKGDLLVASSVKGHAMTNNNGKAGTIIGKAIGSSAGGEAVIEALIHLM